MDGWMLAFCTGLSFARSRSLPPSASGISIGRFCPLKVQIHVELLFLFFILAAQIQTSSVGRTESTK